MKCSLCGHYFSEKTYYRCPKCFPAGKTEKKQSDAKTNVEAFNDGQFLMAYGEEEK